MITSSTNQRATTKRTNKYTRNAVRTYLSYCVDDNSGYGMPGELLLSLWTRSWSASLKRGGADRRESQGVARRRADWVLNWATHTHWAGFELGLADARAFRNSSETDEVESLIVGRISTNDLIRTEKVQPSNVERVLVVSEYPGYQNYGRVAVFQFIVFA